MEKKTVQRRTIFKTVVGSHSYGIATQSSDTDVAGVMIPPKQYFFGTKRFQQYQDPDCDMTIFDLRKMVVLMLENNPNCLDILYAPQKCVLLTTPYWQKIRQSRDLFLSKKAKFTYCGYAFSQAQRIKVHKKFLMDPPKGRPLRSDYGLPQESVFPMSQLDGIISIADSFYKKDDRPQFLQKLRAIYSDQIVPLLKQNIIPQYRNVALQNLNKGLMSQIKAISIIGDEYIKDEYRQAAVNELRYADALRTWQKYTQWKKNRNPKRAILEEKYSYDVKHGAHLVRLLNMGIEIIRDGKVNVDRTGIDADVLLDIRNGGWTYERLLQYSADRMKQLDELYKVSTLRRSPESEEVNRMTVGIIEDYLGNEPGQ